MRYSTRLRNAVLRKVLPPESQNVSAEFGISIQTIQRWISAAQSGTIDHEDALVPPFRKPLAEKYEYVLEAARLSEADKGQWLRECRTGSPLSTQKKLESTLGVDEDD